MNRILKHMRPGHQLTVLLTVLCLSLQTQAQKVASQKTLSDGTRVMTTTEVRFAKDSGLFGRSLVMGMSYITFAEDGSSTFAIVLPQNANHRRSIGIGSRLVLHLQTGETLTLLNVHNIEKSDNRVEFDRTYTVRPEYAITQEQIDQLAQLQVVSLRLETDEEYIDIEQKNYAKEWLFNRTLQRCNDVLRWKLAEQNYLYKSN